MPVTQATGFRLKNTFLQTIMNYSFLGFFTVTLVAASLVSASPHFPLYNDHQNSFTTKPPVPVELFVMSKCPDAVLCEGVFRDVCESFSVSKGLLLNPFSPSMD